MTRRERKNAYNREWCKANADKVNATNKKWREENPEQMKAIRRKHYTTHSERIKVYNRKRYVEQSKQIKAINRKWRKEHPEQMEAIIKARNHRRRARKHNAPGSYLPTDLMHMRKEQKDECYYCSIPLCGKGTIDHKVPLSRNGTNWSKNLCIACKLCNSSKGVKSEVEFKVSNILCA